MKAIFDNGTHKIEVPIGSSINQQPTERLILAKDILQTMPLGTKRKLEAIRTKSDYDIASQAADGDTADLLLSIIQSGNPINVLSVNFDNLMAWMMSKGIITQANVDEVKAINHD